MANTATLAIQIISDATKAAKGFQDTSNQASKMEKSLGRASKVAQVGLLAMGAAAISSAKAAAQDAAAQAKLAGALRRNAGASKSAIAGNEAWIASLSRATGVADDELRPAMATLVRSTGSVATSQKALKLAMDISTATGKPLQTVSAALAKGYAGNTAALGKLVPGLSKATLESKDMSKVTAELSQKVGGEAADAAKTAEGQYRILTNNFSEAKESLGTGFLPILTQLAVVLADAGVWVQNNTTLVLTLAAAFGVVAGATVAVNTAYKVYKAATLALAGAQKVLNAVMRANPIGLIITAVVLLVAGFVLLYKKSDTFRKIVQAVGKAGQAAIGWVVTKAQQLWQKIQSLGPVLTTAKNIGVKAFEAYTLPIRTVIGWVAKLIDKIKGIDWPSPPSWVTKVLNGGLGSLTGSYVDYAAGGAARYGYAPAVFTAPGELKASGPEMILGRIGSRGGPGIVQIVVNGALDPNAVANQIEQLLRRRGVRLGANL